MKRIFSSVFLIFVYPVRFFKKIKINNFLGGLILGAIISLIVNIATVQIQGKLDRQRILEALENEILTNTLDAKNIVTAYSNFLNVYQKPNYFYVTHQFTRDLWQQSSEPLQYVAQLNKSIQSSVVGYYTITIPQTNSMLEKIEELKRDKLANCFDLDGKGLGVSEELNCQSWQRLVKKLENDSAIQIGNAGFDLLKKFHPTEDRLNNILLRLIMGSDSVRILSGK